MNRDVCEHFNPVDLPCEKCSVQKSTLREAAQQALEAMETVELDIEWRAASPTHKMLSKAITALRAALAEPVQSAEANIGCLGMPVNTPVTPPQRPAEPVQEPVAWRFQSAVGGWAYGSEPPLGSKYPAYPLYTAPPQRKPLTMERLRDALVASRIVPPAAVEDPDEYDDGVTLFRIEALHRRIT